MQIETLSSLEDWELAWDELASEDAGSVLVFKLSPICPTSHRAEEEFRRFAASLEDSRDLRLLAVDVIGARPISQRIARDTGIRHESPQALLLSRGHNVLWHASHSAITQNALSDALGLAKV
ncbi:MAG TPA: bacillithiol system redox-active protein YtxJ [Planctomycetota bacterium]|nr:bacillithiol system redox-active protein YtxJ [Planctomycetota bacterium]